MSPQKYFSLEEIKLFRKRIDSLIQELEIGGVHGLVPTNYELESKSMYQSIIKLIEAKMWLGKVCESYGNPFPKEFADKAELPQSN